MDGALLGYIAVLVACLGFGSNYLPAKKVDIRDGQLFNVALASGILFVGLCQWFAFGLYKFEPFAMVGGACWGLGNLSVPLILACCGLGLGQLTWGLSQILMGWATGKFGLFGKEKDHIGNPTLNYVGVAMLMLSLCLFTCMRPPSAEEPETECARQQNASTESARELRRVEEARKPEDHGLGAALNPAPGAAQPAPAPSGAGASGPPSGGRFFVGFFTAVAAGLLYGTNFDPPTYLQQIGRADERAGRVPRHSPKDMDYVISHFCGIFLMTLLGFCVHKAVRPSTFIGKQVILPGFAAGLMWGIAQVAWFKANGTLSYVVAFPIIVGVPGVIAAIWGCILFGENRGSRNAGLLAAIVLLQGVAVVLIALSQG